MPLRRNQVADRIPELSVGVVEDEDVIHKGEPVFRQLAFQIAVVDDYVSPAIRPLRPESSCEAVAMIFHLAVGIAFARIASDPAAADDQQRFIRPGILNVQPFKQDLPTR